MPALAAGAPTGLCVPGGPENLDEDGYEIELCYREFEFENYAYKFSLPQERVGYPYPIRGMAHGVIFPLGPLAKPEEHRELLVWAYFDLAEDEDFNRLPLEAQLRDELAFLAESWTGAAENAVFSKRQQAGLEFLCYSTSDAGRSAQNCIGLNDGIIYNFNMLSTDEYQREDLEYFDRVFETFAILRNN